MVVLAQLTNVSAKALATEILMMFDIVIVLFIVSYLCCVADIIHKMNTIGIVERKPMVMEHGVRIQLNFMANYGQRRQ